MERTVLGSLRDRGLSFVLPSEIAAEAWLERALVLGGEEALEAGRFLGWDSFKELVSAEAEGAGPADDFLRTIFAASYLSANAKEPRLRVLVPPEHAGLHAPFAPCVAAGLPRLRSLSLAVRRRGGPPPSGALADWLDIHRAYEAFLSEQRLYEPSYLPRRLRDPGRRFLVLFPELIEDFAEYEEGLKASGFVRVLSLAEALAGAASGDMAAPASGGAVPGGAATRDGGRAAAPLRLARPGSGLAELRSLLRGIGRLLDEGEAPESLVVTVCGLDTYRPYLEREARLLSVPLDFRSGKALSAYPGPRLFKAAGEAAGSGFAFDAMRDLLLSPAWPWKDPALNRDLVRAGAARCALAPWPAAPGEGGGAARGAAPAPEQTPAAGRTAGRLVDPWEASLPGAEGGAALLGRYRTLRRRIAAMSAAESFAALRKAYAAFRKELFSDEGWEPLADASLARAVDELDGLCRAEEKAGLPVESPFGIFLRVLDQKRYVPQGGSGGVRVYEWRVGAGLAPERHFVLGASQDALSVTYSRFGFLREDERRGLGAEEADATPAFIAAYAESGSQVLFSCPREGFSGERPPHGILLSRAEPGAFPPGSDEYEEELLWLSGEGQAPGRLHAIQRRGLLRGLGAASAGGRKGAVLPPALAATAAARLRGEDGTLRLSTTAIDEYGRCPFAYLYERLLRATEEKAGLEFADAPFLGEVYHEALARLFARIAKEDGRFRPERRLEYADLAGEALDAAFAAFARRRGPFAGVVLSAYRGRMELYLRRLMEREAELFPGLEVGPLEEDFLLRYPEGGDPERGVPPRVALSGRIDRLSLREGRAVVVDYKKGNYPTRAEVAPSVDGSLAEAQVPAYLRLVGASEAGSGGVESAWYLSVEGSSQLEPGSAACAFGPAAFKPYVPEESLPSFLAAFDAALGRTASGILAGDYPFAPKGAQEVACADCASRGICRERYALRL
ncbi:MAG TPA: PD-(D/E)XK nuclease family protein [Spirochaetia bacterium]|nr:PD-(D/E)XK nuclease family protein [Spirochaetia bacterium]